MHLRRLAIASLLLFIACSSTPDGDRTAGPKVSAPALPNASAELTLLQVNDADTLLPTGKAKEGTLPRVATMVNELRASRPHVLFVHAGDMISPAADSSLFKGANMVEGFSRTGIDVAVLGNHEFDFGADTLEELAKAASFPWLAANVTWADTGRRVAGTKDHIIKDLDGIKIGIFGVVTQESGLLPAAKGMVFADPVVAAGQQIELLKAQGVDFVIALTHLDIKEDMELARRYPEIVHISGGHNHDEMVHFTERATITKSGTHARKVARIDFRFERVGGVRTVTRTVQLVEVSPDITPDIEVQAVVERYTANLQKKMEVEIGRTRVPLDAITAHVRNQETNFGNFVTDVARAALDADIGLLNSGAIRPNSVIKPGPITRGTLISLLPYDAYLVKLRLTGKQLLDVLEYGCGHVGKSYGRFPQVSGLSFKLRTTEADGPRVSEVKVGERPLDLTASYTLVTNEFLFKGGDGYSMLTEGEVIISPANAPRLKDLLEAHLLTSSPIAPKVEGRIAQGQADTRPPAQRVIIDIDQSIDGALALLMVLRTPGVATDAVTVVHGMSDVEIGAENTQRVLELAGQPDIPVHLGKPGVPKGGHDFPRFWKAESARMGGAKLPAPTREVASDDAAKAIVDLVNAHPGEITVITLGPLTNLAAALVKDKSIAKKVKSVVVMGGAVRVPGNIDQPFVGFNNTKAEWNFFADPIAAAKVVESFPKVVFVGLDASNQAPVTHDFLRRLEQVAVSPLPLFAYEALKGAEESIGEGRYYFWDALTAAAAVNPSLVGCAPTRIRVHTKPVERAGWTEELKRGGRTVEVCYGTDLKAVEDYFLRMVRP